MNSSAGVGIEHCEVVLFSVKELTTDWEKLKCAVSGSDLTQRNPMPWRCYGAKGRHKIFSLTPWSDSGKKLPIRRPNAE